MFEEMKLRFHARALVERYKTSDKILCLQSKGEKLKIVEHLLRLSEYNNRLNQVGVNLPDEIVMVLQSHYH